MKTHISIVFVIAAALASGIATEPARAQTALPITPSAVQPVQLVRARAEKLLYDVGQTVTGSVIVKNVSNIAQTVTVRAWIEWQLDQTTKSQETNLSIDPGQKASAHFTWDQVPDQFGHAMKAEVVLNGAVVASGEDYFQITDNIWKTGIISAAGSGSRSAQFISDLRRDYYNVYEVFFWAPDDFLGLTPEQNSWLSGQGRYPGVKEGTVDFPYEGKKLGLKDMIALGHDQGIRAISYAKLTGCGPTGFEEARRHPEMVWNSGGVLSVCPDAESIAKWDDRSIKRESIPVDWPAVDYNMNDSKVVDIGIKSLSDSASMFGWDGARWDGNFDVRSETHDLQGKIVDSLTLSQMDSRNAENMRRTKEYISKYHPSYVYGYNYIMTSVQQNLLVNPLETVECCKDGGLLMNEYIRQAAGVNHPLHKWRRYAENLVDDTEHIKRLGGYHGPILDANSGPDSQYRCVFALAGGAHPYFGTLFGAYMTRYSYYYWDPALHQASLPESLFSVSGNLWWDKWVFERSLSATHKQLVVNLINPPDSDGVGLQKALPPPQKDIDVSYLPRPQAGWGLQRVTRLNPTTFTQETLPITVHGGISQVRVPEVALWNTLVFDFVKEGN